MMEVFASEAVREGDMPEHAAFVAMIAKTIEDEQGRFKNQHGGLTPEMLQTGVCTFLNAAYPYLSVDEVLWKLYRACALPDKPDEGMEPQEFAVALAMLAMYIAQNAGVQLWEVIPDALDIELDSARARAGVGDNDA